MIVEKVAGAAVPWRGPQSMPSGDNVGLQFLPVKIVPLSEHAFRTGLAAVSQYAAGQWATRYMYLNRSISNEQQPTLRTTNKAVPVVRDDA